MAATTDNAIYFRAFIEVHLRTQKQLLKLAFDNGKIENKTYLALSDTITITSTQVNLACKLINLPPLELK